MDISHSQNKSKLRPALNISFPVQTVWDWHLKVTGWPTKVTCMCGKSRKKSLGGCFSLKTENQFVYSSTDFLTSHDVSHYICLFVLGKGHKAATGADGPKKCGGASVGGLTASGLYNTHRWNKKIVHE